MEVLDATMNAKKVHTYSRSIRFRLLVSVNSVMLLMLIGFLVLDYRRELKTHIHDKQVSLEEEAKTLLPGVIHLVPHGQAALQNYVDDVCARMEDVDSPGHHIAVELDGKLIQAHAHHRASHDMGAAMKAAAASVNNQSQFNRQELVVGSQSELGTTVYVSENVGQLKSAVIAATLRRMSGLLFMAFVAAIIINLVLLRLISQPLSELVNQVRRIGRGQFEIGHREFGTSELDYLSSEISSMGKRLSDADKQRRNRLNKAREIQTNLLPKNFDIPGMNVAFTYTPAEEVGGDYFDIQPHGENAWLICVADATGHGVPAAMSAAMLKTLLLQAKDLSDSPAEILSEMNRRFMEVNLCGDFATIIVLRIDFGTKKMSYANAGHDPAWLIDSSGKATELPATGTLLGIIEDDCWEEISMPLQEPLRLAISTDGITEAFNAEEQQFGRETLLDEIVNRIDKNVEESAEEVNEVLQQYRGDEEQLDDVTLLLIDIAYMADAIEDSNRGHGTMSPISRIA